MTPAQFCVAWAEASRLTGNPTLALQLATTIPSGAFGIVEYVFRSAPTLRQALAQWCSYLGILDDAELARTLQRRLKDEGTIFQTLRDETRLQLAEQYLGNGLAFAEISFLLGFSEPSAFFRAFKRWTGLTPVEHRLRLNRT